MSTLTDMLRLGSRGSEVVQWQNALRAAGYTGVKPSGLFDSYTETATRDFQLRNRVPVDGIVGPVTRNAMGMAIGINTAPGARSYSRAEAESMPGTQKETVRKPAPKAAPQAVTGLPPETLPAWVTALAMGGIAYLLYSSFRNAS